MVETFEAQRHILGGKKRWMRVNDAYLLMNLLLCKYIQIIFYNMVLFRLWYGGWLFVIHLIWLNHVVYRLALLSV